MTGPGRVGPASAVGGAREQSAEGTACWHAERALLGTLLRRPERLGEMGTWLGGYVFSDPVRRGVFATIQALSTAGPFRPVAAETGALAELDPAAREAIAHNVLAVRNALADQRHTDLPAGSDRDLVRGLYDVGASAVASQYTRYARMVVDVGAPPDRRLGSAP